MQPAVPDSARLAHTFRNFSFVIGGLAELLLAELTDPAQRELAAEIRETVNRASAVTASHLAASHPRPESEPVDVVDFLRAASARISALVGPRIEVRLSCSPPHPLLIRFVPAELDDVLMNLAANARDAMPSGGVLTIRTDVAEAPHAGTLATFCRIVVSDTGHGLPAGLASRVFDPYFTTKEHERGTGIGLFEVARVLAAAGGFISAGASPEGGASFEIHVPLAPDRIPAPILRPPVRRAPAR
jgi:signal transduction histidine kinase